MEKKYLAVRCVGTIPPNSPGDEVTIEVDSDGIPSSYHWRRRLLFGDVVPVTPKARAAKQPAEESKK
ncbi:MAG TPA: hypothetical protein VMX57_08455 [Planctomycetota bacterium]|nr:hypothetical protein [Planctomycetota bacterium]